MLLIGQDGASPASVKMMLAQEKFVYDTTDLNVNGLEIGKLGDYDVSLLDLSVPNRNGYDVLRRLRSAHVRTPVLILLGLAELNHGIKGLGLVTVTC